MKLFTILFHFFPPRYFESSEWSAAGRTEVSEANRVAGTIKEIFDFVLIDLVRVNSNRHLKALFVKTRPDDWNRYLFTA